MSGNGLLKTRSIIGRSFVNCEMNDKWDVKGLVKKKKEEGILSAFFFFLPCVTIELIQPRNSNFLTNVLITL